MRKVRRCVVNPCLAAEEMEAWSRLMACLSFENNLSIEPLRPRFVDCGLEHHYFCLYFECVSYFCFLSCRLMQPVSSYCPWWLDRRRNLRQDGLCLTVRSCTAKFHQDRHVPGASAALKLPVTSYHSFTWAPRGKKMLSWEGHLSLFGVEGYSYLPTSSV